MSNLQTSKTAQDNPEQSKRFEEDARKQEVDETGEAFEKAMGVIVQPKREVVQPRPSGKPASA